VSEQGETIPIGLIDPVGATELMEGGGRHHLLLRQLDRVPEETIYALGREPHEVAVTYSSPTRVACSDGKTYWLKPKAQRGLAVELAAGRIVSRTGAGPNAKIVEVPAVVFRDDPRLGRFNGPVVGSLHLPGTFSTKEIRVMIGSGQFDSRVVDPASRALVIATQTWLNVEDAQVRVGALDGRVYSVDHGVALDAQLRGRPTNVVVVSIPGVSNDLGREWAIMKMAVETIESIREEEILAAVAGMPDAPGWQASFARRLAVATWLIKRQPYVGDVMREWCGVMS
jgi:hypothetical protein